MYWPSTQHMGVSSYYILLHKWRLINATYISFFQSVLKE